MTDQPPEYAEDLPPTVDRLLWLLELERLDRDLFRARSPRHRPNGRLFGGQVAAQALRAATLTVSPSGGEVEHHPHSLHGYFLRPGLPGRPLILSVDRIRDGRSFTTRNVKAIQDGEAIFSLSASFHQDEPAGEYQLPVALDVTGPEGATSEQSSDSGSPFEVRGVASPDDDAAFTSTRRVWVRTNGALPDDRSLHACVLTYISDMGAVMAARKALRIPWSSGGMAASLDHAIWFHRPIRPDHWVLFDLRPLSNASSRGLVLGTMHDEHGVHGASMTQEALVRVKRPS